MHILIFEVDLGGHRSVYLERIVEAHLELGRIVTIAIPEMGSAVPVIKRLRESYKGAVRIAPLSKAKCIQALNSRYGNVGRELSLWHIFNKAFRLVLADRPVDFVFLPYLDYCLNAIGLLGSPFGKTLWSGICMRPTFHYMECGVIAPDSLLLHLKRLLFNRVLRIQSLSCLFSIDELLVAYFGRHNPALAHRLRYLPDPVELPANLDVGQLRENYNIPPDAKVILVFGAINERKGIFVLLDTLESESDLDEWHILIIGQQSYSVRVALLTPRWSKLKNANRLHTIDTFVTGEVEKHVLAICDVVWVAYVGHYQMSGVLVSAGMHRKPVIACEEGLIGWYARNKGVGVTTSQHPFSVAAALKFLSVDAQAARVMGTCGYKQFSHHIWENCQAILTVEACVR